jgi:hypothetical protein
VRGPLWQLLILVAVSAPAGPCFAQIGAPPQQSSDSAPARRNSILVFGGRLSTTDFPTTLLFNLDYTPDYRHGQRSWDNYIGGADYERDLVGLARDLRLRAEVGIDDRFGHYSVCCLTLLPTDPHYRDTTVRTNGLVHSVELQAGGKVRWDNFKLGGGIRLEVAATVGLSGVTRTLGRERGREIDRNGNAHVLGFASPEVGLSLDRVPNFELVFRVLHRSGAGGTFGNIREGYDADVLGLRYAF